MFVADADTYGADKLWCLLKGIPIELDSSDEEIQEVPAAAAGSSSASQ